MLVLPVACMQLMRIRACITIFEAILSGLVGLVDSESVWNHRNLTKPEAVSQSFLTYQYVGGGK